MTNLVNLKVYYTGQPLAIETFKQPVHQYDF